MPQLVSCHKKICHSCHYSSKATKSILKMHQICHKLKVTHEIMNGKKQIRKSWGGKCENFAKKITKEKLLIMIYNETSNAELSEK